MPTSLNHSMRITGWMTVTGARWGKPLLPSFANPCPENANTTVASPALTSLPSKSSVLRSPERVASPIQQRLDQVAPSRQFLGQRSRIGGCERERSQPTHLRIGANPTTTAILSSWWWHGCFAGNEVPKYDALCPVQLPFRD